MRRNYYNKPISKTFIQAFPTFESFFEVWKKSPFFTEKFTENDLHDIYNHLLATYYNWHFIYLDDLGISLNVFHIIEEYYPNVKVRLELAEELRTLTVDEFTKSGLRISSTGANPKIETAMDDLIQLVDSQNVDFQVKSKEQALRTKFSSLIDGIFEDFIERFRPLFTKLYNGLTDYIYENPVEEE